MLISDFKHGLFKYEVKDYFAILGAPIFASPKEVRTRYLKLAYQLHPDTNQGDEQHKAQAANILAKILNPAYENLYKPKYRKECDLILLDAGNRLVDAMDKIIISSDIAQKLLVEEDQKLKLLYEQTISQIAPDQYQDFDKLQIKVGLLSELNLIYLVRQKQQEVSKVRGRNYGSNPIFSSVGNINKTKVSNSNVAKSSTVEQPSSSTSKNNLSPEENITFSRVDKLIASAKSFMEKGNYEPAIVDLKEALKLDGKNAVAHALLGLSYLEQDNTTYAYGRIHIKKAISLDSKKMEVINAQEILDQIEGKGKKSSKADKSSQGKKGKADKKGKGSKAKKEPPKIFGIPLW